MSIAAKAKPAGAAAPAAHDSGLSASQVSISFEGVSALQEVDLSLQRQEILGLIGPNGAGKTTLLNVLSGFARPDRGSIWIDGIDITGWPPFRVARRGLVRTFQAVHSFKDYSVIDNVRMGALAAGMPARQAVRQAEELLEVLSLTTAAQQTARTLPFGHERRLGIARAAATRPSFLLLDEPAAGLNTDETDQLQESIRAIGSYLDCGLLVIEHDMRFIMGLCQRIQVLDYGRTIAVGAPNAVRNDPLVLAAYLGAPDPA